MIIQQHQNSGAVFKRKRGFTVQSGAGSSRDNSRGESPNQRVRLHSEAVHEQFRKSTDNVIRIRTMSGHGSQSRPPSAGATTGGAQGNKHQISTSVAQQSGFSLRDHSQTTRAQPVHSSESKTLINQWMLPAEQTAAPVQPFKQFIIPVKIQQKQQEDLFTAVLQQKGIKKEFQRPIDLSGGKYRGLKRKNQANTDISYENDINQRLHSLQKVPSQEGKQDTLGRGNFRTIAQFATGQHSRNSLERRNAETDRLPSQESEELSFYAKAAAALVQNTTAQKYQPIIAAAAAQSAAGGTNPLFRPIRTTSNSNNNPQLLIRKTATGNHVPPINKQLYAIKSHRDSMKRIIKGDREILELRAQNTSAKSLRDNQLSQNGEESILQQHNTNKITTNSNKPESFQQQQRIHTQGSEGQQLSMQSVQSVSARRLKISNRNHTDTNDSQFNSNNTLITAEDEDNQMTTNKIARNSIKNYFHCDQKIQDQKQSVDRVPEQLRQSRIARKFSQDGSQFRPPPLPKLVPYLQAHLDSKADDLEEDLGSILRRQSNAEPHSADVLAHTTANSVKRRDSAAPSIQILQASSSARKNILIDNKQLAKEVSSKVEAKTENKYNNNGVHRDVLQLLPGAVVNPCEDINRLQQSQQAQELIKTMINVAESKILEQLPEVASYDQSAENWVQSDVIEDSYDKVWQSYLKKQQADAHTVDSRLQQSKQLSHHKQRVSHMADSTSNKNLTVVCPPSQFLQQKVSQEVEQQQQQQQQQQQNVLQKFSLNGRLQTIVENNNSGSLKLQSPAPPTSEHTQNPISVNAINTVESLKTPLTALPRPETSNSNAGDNEFSSDEPERGVLIRWKQGRFLGAGNFAQVFKALNIETGAVFAVKRFNLRNCDKIMVEAIKKEVHIMKELHHEHIVQYYGNEQLDEHTLYIYIEYMEGGNLLSTIKNEGVGAPEARVREVATQMLSALQYLHSQGRIHRDLKCANVLQDAQGRIKLADFGCSKQIDMAVTSSCKTEGMHITGSVPWAAPEVVTQTSYGRRSDIWSFGCTVLELATGRQPWHEAALDNPCAFIVKIGLSTDIPLIPDTLSPPLADFIRICLNRDKHARPHASDLLRHPFIVGVHSV